MADELKWWQRPVRMMRRDYIGAFEKFMSSDLEALARESKERWHINCEWVMATPGCSPGLAHQTLFNSAKFEKFPRLGDFDMLRAYLPHARKHGVHLLPYVNMHWYSYDFAAKHPGWEQLLEDGTPYGRKHPLYGNGTTMCVNGPWRDWAFEMIREVMRTGVDGCFLDGPVVFPGCCYCASCQALFARESGRKRLPADNDWSDPAWKPFTRFRADSWARFMQGAQQAALEINPDAAIFLNGGGWRSHSLDSARDPRQMELYQNFTGAEEFFHCRSSYNSPYNSLNLARFLSAGERPAVVFTHHALSTWHYIPLPPAEMATAYAQTVAGGANTWFAIFMDAMTTRADEAFQGVSLGEFLAENEAYYTATVSAAETAVLLSNNTIYAYLTRHAELTRTAGGGREENLVADAAGTGTREGLAARREAAAAILDNEAAGCMDAFNFGHVPFRVLWDHHLNPSKMKGVKTLVLPNAACLSDEQIRAIRQFVERGGGLVATFESGMYDDEGELKPRKEWLRFLGIENVVGAWTPSRTEDYVTLTTGKLAGLADGKLLPRPLNALKVTPARDAEVLALYCNSIGMAYQPLVGVSRYPALLMSRRGKGRVLYAASPLFESFELYHIDDHKVVACALAALASGKTRPQVETNAPPSLAVEVRAQKGRVLVHLVNVTGDMKRPMNNIVPLYDVEISLRAGKVKAVKALRANRRLPFKVQGDRVAVRVPRVEEYEVLALETGS